MGTQAHVIVVGGAPAIVENARHRIGELDRRWSRFRADSELSQLNCHAGIPFQVSVETRLLVARGIEGFIVSGGAFDPTLLGAIIRAGYDRTFAELDDAPGSGSLLEIGCGGIELGDATVLMPANTGFDSGGIGKGLAADLVATEAMEAGADGVCINLGGDVRVLGAGPRGDSWIVGVEHPLRHDTFALLELADRAVATSTTLKRRWRSAGVDRHHVIDPRSGEPSESDISFVSVVADEGWRAEVLAKAVLVNGGPHCFDILGGTGAEALAVTVDGDVLVTDEFAVLLGGRIPAPLSLPG